MPVFVLLNYNYFWRLVKLPLVVYDLCRNNLWYNFSPCERNAYADYMTWQNLEMNHKQLPASELAIRVNANITWSPLFADIIKEFMEFSVAKLLWISDFTAAMCFKSSVETTFDACQENQCQGSLLLFPTSAIYGSGAFWNDRREMRYQSSRLAKLS